MAFRILALVLTAGLAACSSDAERTRDGSSAATPAAAVPAASPSPQNSSERKYLLERVDDAAVVQLYADGFATLPLDEKTLIWHLYQAAIAGRDIFYDQKHRDALEMRALLEQIVAPPAGRRAGRRSPRSSATPSCSGSTTVPTTT